MEYGLPSSHALNTVCLTRYFLHYVVTSGGPIDAITIAVMCATVFSLVMLVGIESTFEFGALEVALEAICSFLDAHITELETVAYPTLDELTSKKIHKSRMRAAKSKRKNSNENMNATSLNFRYTFVLLPEGNTLKKDHGDINNFSEPVGTAILESGSIGGTLCSHVPGTQGVHIKLTYMPRKSLEQPHRIANWVSRNNTSFQGPGTKYTVQM